MMKFNTLTPAEAKKLNRYMGNRPPIRTASVLRRPRAPPIVVTDLDSNVERELLDDGLSSCRLDAIDGQRPSSQAFSESIQNGSIYQVGVERRHSVNYGRSSTMTSRQSLFSTASVRNPVKSHHQHQQQQQHQQLQISPQDSLSNLSFRSSRDTPDPDYARESAANRFQTMSVDLGAQQHKLAARPASVAYDTMRARLRYGSQKSNTINTRFSDDSFSSAKSEMSNISGRSSSVTPTKFSHFPAIVREAPRSASKLSLSSSTYKVFQSPLANFKKLFRGMQRPFSQASNTESRITNEVAAKTTKQQQCDKSLADLSMSDSISQISLNKSQSPTVLPPPPSELKSMSYLESESNYSNYDEFTRSRNERVIVPRGNLRNFTNGGGGDALVPSGRQQNNNLSSNTFNSNHQQQQPSPNKSDDSDDSSWQMTSLPVYYERNLTTVFEERHHQSTRIEVAVASSRQTPIASSDFERKLTLADADEIYQTIKPPKRFDDPNNQSQEQPTTNDGGGEKNRPERAPSVDSSKSQPAQSISTISDSTILEFHRQQPATPFRFSFAQPLNDTNQQATLNPNLGLPPRMPASGYNQQAPAAAAATLINSENQRQDNSSSGNSSNCSSQMNGINYCDRQNSLESSAGTPADANDNLSVSLDDSGGYGILTMDLENDPDSTILSEASTIRGDSTTLYYTNKCAELERTVATLKNKLIAKEKELTELQLSQLNNDYAIERYKKQVNKLERENAQLRTMVARNSQSSAATGSNTISRMQM